VARCFPVRIGRDAASDLRFEDPGIWDQHLQVDLVSSQGFLLTVQGQALVRLNGQSVQSAVLRNGDLIEFGNVRLRFWLAPARQSRLRLGEAVSWGAVVLLTLGQAALLYWLIK
jgi:pSer/pThr/pTyr-binding forkhead associated (FHA) protein